MKKIYISLLLLASPMLAHSQIGVSVNIGEPGFYGQIELGNLPAPPVIYSQPVIVQAPPAGVVSPPLYLRVPPEHHKHWEKYCHEYNACGRHVYFVNDEWYTHTYVPHYAEEHHHDHDHEHHDHGHENDHEHHDHENDHDHEHHEEH